MDNGTHLGLHVFYSTICPPSSCDDIEVQTDFHASVPRIDTLSSYPVLPACKEVHPLPCLSLRYYP